MEKGAYRRGKGWWIARTCFWQGMAARAFLFELWQVRCQFQEELRRLRARARKDEDATSMSSEVTYSSQTPQCSRGK